MSNLPPGISDSDIPGNTAEDESHSELLTKIENSLLSLTKDQLITFILQNMVDYDPDELANDYLQILDTINETQRPDHHLESLRTSLISLTTEIEELLSDIPSSIADPAFSHWLNPIKSCLFQTSLLETPPVTIEDTILSLTEYYNAEESIFSTEYPTKK